MLCYFGLYPLLDDGLISSIFDDYLCDDDVIIFSLVHVCECQFIISYSHSFSKVLHYNFLVMIRKVEIPKSCPTRDRAGR